MSIILATSCAALSFPAESQRWVPRRQIASTHRRQSSQLPGDVYALAVERPMENPHNNRILANFVRKCR
jgi:hypothetical protein